MTDRDVSSIINKVSGKMKSPEITWRQIGVHIRNYTQKRNIKN